MPEIHIYFHDAFVESEHPRDDDGKFSEISGGGGTKMSSKLTEQQGIEAKDYAEGGYKALNSYLRGGATRESMKAHHEATAKRLDAAIRKSSLERNTLLYRGIQHSALAAGAEKLIGRDIPVATFQSTSSSQKSASEFAGLGKDAVLFRIEAPKGSRALSMKQFEGSGNKNEDEYLLPRGGSMRVTGVDRSGRIPVVSLRLLQEGAN
jgi:hypothetical protein